MDMDSDGSKKWLALAEPTFSWQLSMGARGTLMYLKGDLKFFPRP